MEPWLVFAGTIVTAAGSIIAVVLTNNRANREIISRMESSDAVQEEKIAELTREVRKHNNFAERVPVLEGDMKVLKEQIKNIRYQLNDAGK
jgi:hypothetical protein|nr:MAG TPA_asm: Protein of unknown function (DUF2730) [Caudoviricetes sp.]